ncbi:uncharacterized protein [Physcomitrium patens]
MMKLRWMNLQGENIYRHATCSVPARPPTPLRASSLALSLSHTLSLYLPIALQPSPSRESDRHLPEQVPVHFWNCRRASRCASARSPIDALNGGGKRGSIVL